MASMGTAEQAPCPLQNGDCAPFWHDGSAGRIVVSRRRVGSASPPHRLEAIRTTRIGEMGSRSGTFADALTVHPDSGQPDGVLHLRRHSASPIHAFTTGGGRGTTDDSIGWGTHDTTGHRRTRRP